MSTTAQPPRTYTPEDLLALTDGPPFELVDGRLEELDVSNLASNVMMKFARILGNHVEPRELGWLYGPETMLRCFSWKPDTIRKPDICFVRRERMPVAQVPEGFLTVVPDLVIEILSPNDLASRLERKLKEYRRAGIPLIWVVEPESRTARVHRADGSAQDLDEDGTLDGEGVLPGFRCRVGDLFPTPTPADAAD